jgi:hypothetical protein
MKNNHLLLRFTKVLSKLSLLLLTAIAFAVNPPTAKAGTIINDWNIATDPHDDSLWIDSSGIFELHNMGIKDDGENIWVGINGNVPLTGHNTGYSVAGFPISNGNIGLGDLFFDFSGSGNFENASNNHGLYGVRFSPNNDSGVSSLGLYEYVKAKDVEKLNAGYWNLGSYNLEVRQNTGHDGQVGDLAVNNPYYAPYTNSYTSKPMPNVISEGQYKGGITLLNNSDLLAAGFNPGILPTQGAYTYGFKFAKSLLPNGNYIASLFEECLNDGIALVGSFEPKKLEPPQSVPESSSILGISLLGTLFLFRKGNRQKI